MTSLALSIGLISCLKRRDDGGENSFPSGVTDTVWATPTPAGLPEMPWIKQSYTVGCGGGSPKRMDAVLLPLALAAGMPVLMVLPKVVKSEPASFPIIY